MKQAGITRIANITGLDTVGIPVVIVVRPNSRSLSVSQGKGATLEAAKMSGVMESLEQSLAETPDLPLRMTTQRELSRRRRVVDVERLPRTPRDWTPDARILWTTAEDVRTGEPVEVPFEIVHLDMTEPLPEGSGYFALGSNGLASQDCRARAQLHAICELIERDALALFYERPGEDQQRRRLRLGSVNEPGALALLRRFENAEVGVAVWNMTSDIGIPAFFCSIGEKELDPLRPVGTARGFGCHPNRGIALCRALTEAAQSRLTRIAGSRDDIQSQEFAAVRARDTVERQRQHVAEERFATLDYSDLETSDFELPASALGFTLDRLALCGFTEVLTVNLAQPGYPFAVERCVVPGLEGVADAPTYVPGPRVTALRAGASS